MYNSNPILSRISSQLQENLKISQLPNNQQNEAQKPVNVIVAQLEKKN